MGDSPPSSSAFSDEIYPRRVLKAFDQKSVLGLGPLQNYDIPLPQETLDLLAERTPKGIPDNLLPMLVKFYLAHLQEGEEWVVFPISAVDTYYGGNSFSKKWKPLLPKNIVEFKNSYGICKYNTIFKLNSLSSI